MKVYRVVLMIVDHDSVGDEMADTIENVRYPNRCLSPHVVKIDSRDIGEWYDEHPLNNSGTSKDEFARLFGTAAN